MINLHNYKQFKQTPAEQLISGMKFCSCWLAAMVLLIAVMETVLIYQIEEKHQRRKAQPTAEEIINQVATYKYAPALNADRQEGLKDE